MSWVEQWFFLGGGRVSEMFGWFHLKSFIMNSLIYPKLFFYIFTIWMTVQRFEKKSRSLDMMVTNDSRGVEINVSSHRYLPLRYHTVLRLINIIVPWTFAKSWILKQGFLTSEFARCHRSSSILVSAWIKWVANELQSADEWGNMKI